jgi:hypothetical protein
MDRQYVGIDFHRRRSVVVRKNAAGEKLSSVHVANDPGDLGDSGGGGPPESSHRTMDDIVNHRHARASVGDDGRRVASILLLCSDDASFITGEMLRVSGGFATGDLSDA